MVRAKSHRCAVVAAIVIAVLFYFLMRAARGHRDPTWRGPSARITEWAEYAPKIQLDGQKHRSEESLGDIVMNLRPRRNFTGDVRGLR